MWKKQFGWYVKDIYPEYCITEMSIEVSMLASHTLPVLSPNTTFYLKG